MTSEPLDLLRLKALQVDELFDYPKQQDRIDEILVSMNASELEIMRDAISMFRGMTGMFPPFSLRLCVEWLIRCYQGTMQTVLEPERIKEMIENDERVLQELAEARGLRYQSQLGRLKRKL